MVRFHLLPGYSTETPVWGLFFTLSYSHHPPTWGQLPHQRRPCLSIYTACFLSPTLQLGDFPLLSSSVEDRSLPVLSHLSPSPPVIFLFHHKAVWSCPLFLSKRFLTLGASPLSFSPPLTSQLSFPTLLWPWLEPLGLSTGVCLHFLHFPQVLVPLAVPLSQTVNTDSSLAGPGAVCEWAEGRHPWAARRFQPGRDVPRCLGVTRVSFSLAVKVWGHPEMRFE